MVVSPLFEVLFTKRSMHLRRQFRTLLEAFVKVFKSTLLSWTVRTNRFIISTVDTTYGSPH
jgi:hypothetical protein